MIAHILLPPGFRWLPGMRWRVDRPAPLDSIVGRIGDLASEMYPGARPDFTDPLTALGLLLLVRERHNVDGVWAITPAFNAFTRTWGVIAVREGTGDVVALSASHSTETEALLAALAAAPRKG